MSGVDTQKLPSPMDNPFYSGEINGRPYFACGADDRIGRVRRFTLEQCDAAESLPVALQKSVLAAIKRRRKQLEKEQ